MSDRLRNIFNALSPRSRPSSAIGNGLGNALPSSGSQDTRLDASVPSAPVSPGATDFPTSTKSHRRDRFMKPIARLLIHSRRSISGDRPEIAVANARTVTVTQPPRSPETTTSAPAITPSGRKSANGAGSLSAPRAAMVFSTPMAGDLPIAGAKIKNSVVDNVVLALDVVQKLAEFLQTVPFIAPAGGVLSQLVSIYKEATATNDKRDALRTQVADITDDLCATVLRLEATKHVDLLTRLKRDIETYAGLALLTVASAFMTEYDDLGTIQHFAARDQLGTQLDDLRQQLESFGARFRTNRLVDLAIQHNVMKETLDEVHNMTVEEKFEKWLDSPPSMKGKQHDTQKLHKAGTGDWFLGSDTFVEWQDYGGILWIRGLSGSGKSVLCSTVINKLKNDRTLSGNLVWPPAVAFFYFDFREKKTQVVEIALRRIVLQLSAQSPNHYAVLDKHYRSSHGQILPTYSDLLQILQELLCELDRTYVVFDALDECDDTELTRLIDLITMLRGWAQHPLHLLFTSQPRAIFTSGFEGVTSIELQPSFTQSDIRHFVTSELQDNNSLKTWTSYRSSEIIDHIVIKSHGMFRLAACLLVELSRSRRHDLINTLQDLPNDLFGIYDRFMEAIPPRDLVYATAVLCWLLYSRRDWSDEYGRFRVDTIPTLADAVSFKFSTTSEYIYDPSLREENAVWIPKWLEGLVTITAPDNRLTLAHSSVQQYILSKQFMDRFHIDLNSGSSHRFIAQSCVSYLLYFCDHQVSKGESNQYPLAPYMARNWCFHMERCDDRTTLLDIIPRLLDDGSRQYTLTQFKPKSPYLQGLDYSLRTSVYICSKSGYTELVRRLLDRGVDANALGGKYGSALSAACSRGHTGTVQLLLDRGAEVDKPRDGGEYQSALRLASLLGHTEILQLLLNRGAEVNNAWLHSEYESVLRVAALKGHTEIVRLILEHGADVNAGSPTYGFVLHAASEEGYTGIVQLLLDHGANVSAQGGEYRSALHAASGEGRTETVQLLLDHGADINAQHKVYGSPLQTAAGEGAMGHRFQFVGRRSEVNDKVPEEKCGFALQAARCAETVKLLLDRGADVNVQGGLYASALQAGSRMGNRETVNILLDHGAEVNAQGGKYGCALQAASSQDQLEIVHLLLDRGAEVNIKGGYYGFALHAAAWHGNTEIVQLLLERGADVNTQDAPHGLALQAACFQGRTEITQLLLDHGAEVNGQDKLYGSPLHAASVGGGMEIIQLLLDRGAEVNMLNGKFGFALDAACEKGHAQITQLLLDHGAEVNAQGGRYGYALQAASFWGHREIIQLLLNHGADVNAQGGRSGFALHAACERGHAYIAELLIDHGAEVNAQGGRCGSALQAAARNGDMYTVQLLLNHGAEVNAQGGLYGSALQAAPLPWVRGVEKIVELLLQHGADIDAQGGKYGCALAAAAFRGSVPSVQLLLDYGADVNRRGGIFGSALHAASYAGEPDAAQIVQLLLEHGAHINAPGGLSGSRIQVYTQLVPEIVPILPLIYGEERLNDPVGCAGSALEAAHSEQHTEIVELLLERGAIDTRPTSSSESEPGLETQRTREIGKEEWNAACFRLDYRR